MPAVIPYIPEQITVHLGPPGSNAPNVTVPFKDYVKNVASSEIYPTWDESALRANILAIISFALNLEVGISNFLTYSISTFRGLCKEVRKKFTFHFEERQHGFEPSDKRRLILGQNKDYRRYRDWTLSGHCRVQ